MEEEIEITPSGEAVIWRPQVVDVTELQSEIVSLQNRMEEITLLVETEQPELNEAIQQINAERQGQIDRLRQEIFHKQELLTKIQDAG